MDAESRHDNHAYVAAVTRNGARYCEMGIEPGTLGPGKLTVVLVVDGYPFGDFHALTICVLRCVRV